MAKLRTKTIRCQFCNFRFVPQRRGSGLAKVQVCPYCQKCQERPASKSELVSRADWYHSRLARFLRADRNGNVRCCTCGVQKQWTEVDCGHYMSRSYHATRWEFDNTWPQCKLCNTGYGCRAWKPNDNVRSRYESFLRENVGIDAPDRIHAKAIQDRHWTVFELQDLVRKLERQCHGLGID